MMKKRWLSLYVENNIGVLAKISGLFAGKNYNLNSLTVGTTNDITVSRMTISLTSSDELFEQIKKQLNRLVEIIKVVDLTDLDVMIKELLFIKVKNYTSEERNEIFQTASVFNAKVCDYGRSSILLETTASYEKNNQLILLMGQYKDIEIVRSGAVAIEACDKTE